MELPQTPRLESPWCATSEALGPEMEESLACCRVAQAQRRQRRSKAGRPAVEHADVAAGVLVLQALHYRLEVRPVGGTQSDVDVLRLMHC